MRLAIMQLVQEQLHGFLTIAAIDLQGNTKKRLLILFKNSYQIIYYNTTCKYMFQV